MNTSIALLTGSLFDYLEPHKTRVSILDIAGPLSRICRFSGHLPEFYSVAQHAVNVSLLVEPKFAFTALMHDTAEAFTNDITTPLKTAVPAFKDIEVAIETAMSEQFGFTYPLPPEVKYADLQMLLVEKELFKRDFSHWAILDAVHIYPQDLKHLHLRPLAPAEAEQLFMRRYYETVA